MKIYLASSWRNEQQHSVLAALRGANFEVYDFRHPSPGDDGFHWSEIDGGWKTWTPERFRDALDHPVARHGFANDWDAMNWADCGVLLLPCGRSAHLEAGYFVGAGKRLHILLAGDNEPELMYKMADSINVTVAELIDNIAFYGVA